jgi:ParB family chromosome partitioning protein
VSGNGVKDANLTNLESRLRERLGTKVQLRYAQGKGASMIHFFSDAELDRLLEIIGWPQIERSMP